MDLVVMRVDSGPGDVVGNVSGNCVLVRVSVAHRESSGKERLSGRPSGAPHCMLCQGTGGCGPRSEVPGSVSLLFSPAEALFWSVLPQRVA